LLPLPLPMVIMNKFRMF